MKPLREQAKVYTERAGRIKAFLRYANRTASAIDDPMLEQHELAMEARWLLEDAGVDSGCIRCWQTATLARRASCCGGNDAKVTMGASVDTLRLLWHKRLHDRVPFQQLVGATFWRDLFLEVNQHVLAPRPETEVLASLAMRKLDTLPTSLHTAPVIDVGTGAAPIAISLLLHAEEHSILEKPPHVIAIDSSLEALRVAAANASRYSVDTQLELVHGSLLTPMLHRGIKAAGVVANLPYVPSERLPTLQPEVRLHEPIEALDGGSISGSSLLQQLVLQLPRCLHDGAFVALETDGGSQAQRVANQLTEHGFSDVQLYADYNGTEQRFVVANWVSTDATES